MKSALRACVFSGLLLVCGGLFANAGAQEVTPIPLPDIGPVAPAPDGAQATHDETANTLLSYMVELSRFMGGGIAQLFASAHLTQTLLQSQLTAITGPKPFPLINGQEDIAARQAGPGLWEMANAALSGGVIGPDFLQNVLTEFRTKFHLDEAFALQNDELPSKVMVAQVAAQGAVAALTAENAYKRANNSMQRVNGYIGALQTSNDLKTSIDINTRVMIEVAQQLNETLRTQAAIASMAGTYFMVLGVDSAEPDSFRDLMNFNR